MQVMTNIKPRLFYLGYNPSTHIIGDLMKHGASIEFF